MAPNYKDEWPLHMRWPFQILFLGETDQKPVISVRPTGMVPLRGSVTIHCHCETTSQVSWHFTKHNSDTGTTVDTKQDQPCQVVFSIRKADFSNAGIYVCRYCVQEYCSDFSNQISINLTDPNLPKPSIKMELQGKDASGLNVSISCQGPKDGLTFALYNSREQIAFQTAKRKRNTTVFLVFMARPKDARNYSCQYHSKKNEFVWSEPSDPEELTVEGQHPPKPSISVSPNVVVPVGGNITIRCKSEERYLPTRFILSKEMSGSLDDINSQLVERAKAVFHIVHAEPSDAGIYQCIFKSEHQKWSDYSDKVDIKIKEVFYPKPFISVDPKGVVPLGAHVSIQCNSTEYRQAEFNILKEGSPEPTQIKMVDGEATVFSISSVKLSDGGIYWCEYRDSPTLVDQYFHASNRVYINVTDPSLTKPLIQMKPKGQHGLGVKLTIHCEGPENSLTFSLYKSVNMVASKTVNPNRNKTAFSIPTASEKPKEYTCQYHHKENPFVWSESSDPLKLTPGGSIANDGTQPVNMPQEAEAGEDPSEAGEDPSEAGEDPNEVSYAVLNLNSLNIKQATNLNSNPDSCVYAMVAKNIIRESP
ncbi:hypothetical protein JRQ81_005791 [Phrynocephalus forsythii]|uniref:Ig-like domain-containing protein n=1 Tax=Phrynocephalus forsythii TaxID=171643 RepID=A0A9Q0XGQ6_9SAUR|nr:hypothetical protein JRQ81_005791 [Phrynocephalus forsythii]